MNGISDLTERIENLEPEVESTVEKKQEILEKEQALNTALNDLERDLQLMSSLQKQLDITQRDYNFIESTLADYREQVTEIQNELTEMVEVTEKSTGVIEDLGKIGVVPDESIAILNDRKELIDQCSDQLQVVSDLLDLNYYIHMVKSVSVSDSEQKAESDQEENDSANGSFQQQLEAQLAEYSSWNGVLFHGSITNNYSNILTNRMNGATPAARKVFEKYRTSLIVRDSTYLGGNHYNSSADGISERGVYINAFKDEDDDRGKGVAFYHEMGHMIDHASNQFHSFTSVNNVDFCLALRADAAEVTEWFCGLSGTSKSDFLDCLDEGKCNSLSDLLEPLSGGIIIGGYGHTPDYWQSPGAIEKEAFAHFFEASMGHDPKLDERKKDILSYFFPRAWNEFEKMLEQIGKD